MVCGLRRLWRHHHGVYCHLSLGAAAQLSVFIFTPVVLGSVWVTNGRELMNRCCGVNAASLCERGFSQPVRVLPLPVCDDASTQIIHVDEFMLSIMLMRRPSLHCELILQLKWQLLTEIYRCQWHMTARALWGKSFMHRSLKIKIFLKHA